MKILKTKTLLIGAGLALLASGCATPPETYKGAMQLPRAEATQVSSVSHTINFGDNGSLSEAEKLELDTFLYSQGVGYGDELILEFSENDDNWAAKMDAVTGFLKTRGVWVDYAGPGGNVMDPSSASFTVNRYRASAPDCMAISQNTFDPTELEVNPTFGCITAHNLAVMVAKPQELNNPTEDSLPYTYASVRALQLFRGRVGRSYLEGALPVEVVIVEEIQEEEK